MALFKQYSLTASGICSLCWRGDELVDWVERPRFRADGTMREAPMHYGYRFDAATASPDGRFAVTLADQRVPHCMIDGPANNYHRPKHDHNERGNADYPFV
jgi:hypothetical protein